MAALISRDTPFYMSECLAALYGESRCKLVVARARIYFANGSTNLLKFKTQNSAKFQICRFYQFQILRISDRANLSKLKFS